MSAKPLILIDGSSWLFRAFHALPPLTNPQGEPTGAVFGMTSMLKRLQKDYAPERIAVIFDPPGPTFRNELYADYKATRDETPEELSRQFPIVRELIEALGLPVLQVPNFEADDVIGTLARQAPRTGLAGAHRHWRQGHGAAGGRARATARHHEEPHARCRRGAGRNSA